MPNNTEIETEENDNANETAGSFGVDSGSAVEQERKREVEMDKNEQKQAKEQGGGSGQKEDATKQDMGSKVKNLINFASIKNKNIFIKILVISGAFWGVVFLIGTGAWVKCFKDDPFMTVIISLVWVLIIVGTVVGFVMILLRGSCDDATTKTGQAFGIIPDYCQHMGVGVGADEAPLMRPVGLDKIK